VEKVTTLDSLRKLRRDWSDKAEDDTDPWLTIEGDAAYWLLDYTIRLADDPINTFLRKYEKENQ
jgi:hypothetical protein